MSGVMWDAPELAERYDRMSDTQFKSGSALVDRMNIKKGDNVLDVGCGTGRLAIYVSMIVGQSGCVTGIDPSPHRVRVADRKRNTVATKSLKFMIGCGEDLGAFSENTFDHIYYSSVFHWIGEKDRALREAYRALRHGGNVGITTVDKSQHFAMKKAMEDIFSKYSTTDDIKPDDFDKMILDKNELNDMLKSAGFRDITIDIKDETLYFSSTEMFLQFIEASSFGNFLRNVPDKLRARVRGDIGKELEKLRTGEGITLPSNVMYAIAKKP
jgi:arsenite methyltransferase